MEDLDHEQLNMQEITTKYEGILTEKWGRMFSTSAIPSHLEKLKKHTESFFLEVVEITELLEKRVNAEKKIIKEEDADVKVELASLTSEAPLAGFESSLHESLQGVTKRSQCRRKRIQRLLAEQDVLCEQLGEPPRSLLCDPFPTEQDFKSFSSHLDMLRDERKTRWNQVCALRKDIKRHMQILGLKTATKADDRLLNDSRIKLSEDTIAELARFQEQYASQVFEVSEKIDEIHCKLESLWDRLETSPSRRQRFTEPTGYDQQTYDRYLEELQRCETLLSKNLKKYVEAARRDLEVWWQKTLKSDVERNRFLSFYSDCYTADLLTLHDLELNDLKDFYAANRQIFELYAQRKSLWERMLALEAKASEPGRYHNRGGQLLKEERERNTIATELPKIEKQISELVLEFQKREKSEFTVEGRNILEVMAGDWERKRQKRVLQSSVRKHVGTPQSQNRCMITSTSRAIRNANTTTIRTATSIRKASVRMNLSAMRPVSAQSRKIDDFVRHCPAARRSLMAALNSPSMFSHPAPTVGGAMSSVKSTASKPGPRIIASAIARRLSGRLSISHITKRRLGRKKAPPSIAVNNDLVLWSEIDKKPPPSGEKHFKHVNTSKENRISGQRSPQQQHRRIASPLAYVFNSRLMPTSPMPMRNRSPGLPLAHSPSCSAASNGRKLISKNLPIII